MRRIGQTVPIFLALLFPSPSSVQAFPHFLLYQGQYTLNGIPSDGNVSMEFRITDGSDIACGASVNGSTLFWTSGPTEVATSEGLFSYKLGFLPDGVSQDPSFLSINWNLPGAAYYIDVCVAGVSLNPKDLIGSSAYSFYSSSAGFASVAGSVSNLSLDPSSVTLQGNSFNLPGRLVRLDGSGRLPAVDASQLTNLPLAAGAALTASTQTFSGQNTFIAQTLVSSHLFVSGGNLGVGILSPLSRLHVSGGDLRVGDSSASTLSASGFLALANLSAVPPAGRGVLYFDSTGQGALKISLDGTSFVALSTGVSGSGLTTVVADAEQFSGDGSIGSALTLLSSSVTLQGNTFNAANALLRLDGNALVPNALLDSSSVTKLGSSIDLGSEIAGILAVANGGTGAQTASGARAALGAASSGANADIASLGAFTAQGSITLAPGSRILTAAGEDGVLISTSVFVGSGAGVSTITPAGIFAANFTGSGAGLNSIPQGAVLNLASDLGERLLRSGDSMSGPLTLRGSTLTVTGNALSVGGSALVVADGNVGMGILSPLARLHVSGGDLRVGDSSASTFSASGFLSLANLTSEPNPARGRLFFDSSAQALKISLDGNSFVAIATGSAGAGLSSVVSNNSQFAGSGISGNPLTLLSSSVTLQGNSFNQANNLLLLDNSGLVLAAQIPGLSASKITSGSFGDSRVAISTAAVVQGKFADDKVAVTTAAVAGSFGDSQVAISTAAVGGKWETGRIAAGTLPADVVASSITNNSVTAGKIAAGTIVNVDVSASADITQSKIAGLTADLAARLLKAGDSMSGQLTVGSTLTVTGNAFSVGGSAWVVAGGNVGISSSNPQGLFVVGKGTMVVTTGGRLGIGTTSPLARLQVSSLGSEPASAHTILIDEGVVINWGNVGDGPIIEGSLTNGLLLGDDPSFPDALVIRRNGDVAVGIPAGTPPSARLHVSSPAASGETIFLVSSGTLTSQRILTVHGAGNVGIGTMEPETRLDVQSAGSASSDFGQIWRDSSGVIQASMSAAGVLFADGSGLRNLPFAPSNMATTDTDQTISGIKTFTSTLTVTANAFSVGISTLAVAGGNVGIGITGPSEMLDVLGAVRLGNTLGANAGTIRWTGANFEGYDGTAWKTLDVQATSGGGWTEDGAGNKVYVSNSGRNVGIGTTSPGAALEVAGQIRHALGIVSTGAGVIGSVAGNARGTGANDLQAFRSAASQVASGAYSVIGGGLGNTASNVHSTVGGGFENIASGEQSAVVGGLANTASGRLTAIGGGQSNTADADSSVIGGGSGNTASGFAGTVGGGTGNRAIGTRASTVAGGEGNLASGAGSTVGGGGYDGISTSNLFGNTASGAASTVSGGITNLASRLYSTVGGGRGNTASSIYSTVGGGNENVASGDDVSHFGSTVGGGASNTASRLYSTVGGGFGNTAGGRYSTVAGGRSNTAGSDSATTATVPGGEANEAIGDYSLAAGYRAKANFKGDFVWADSQNLDFNSTVADQFAVRAQGGFYATASSFTFANLAAGATYLFMQSGGNIGIGTTLPVTRLDVQSAGSTSTDFGQIWKNSSGVIQASMSATGVLFADGSGLRNLPFAPSNMATTDTEQIISGVKTFTSSLMVAAGTASTDFGQIWKNSSGIIQASMSATGVLFADGSGLRNLPFAPANMATTDTNQIISGIKTFTSTLTVSANAFSVGSSTLVVKEGQIGIGTATPESRLDVQSAGTASTDFGQIWKNSSGIIQASMSATGVLFADGSGLRSLPSSAVTTGAAQTISGIKTFTSSLTVTASAFSVGSSTLVVKEGQIGIGTVTPESRLDVQSVGSALSDFGQIWRNSSGIVQASMSATGVLFADGSGLRNLPPASPPSNVVTTDTAQTVSGVKTFSSSLTVTANAFSVGGSTTFVVQAGNVGIGAANPAAALVVTGQIRHATGIISEGIGTGNPLNDAVGSARGTGAIDLQTLRTIASQVASGAYAVIGGGRENTASGDRATVSGGYTNTASGDRATVSGGFINTASAFLSTVGGGTNNTASNSYSTVGGGLSNAASGQGATVGGGGRDGVSSYFGNTASGAVSTVPGGLANAASGDYSFAAGRRAKANLKGDFVWADSQDSDFNSTAADQFAVRAQGGFYVTSSSFTFANLAAGTTYLFIQSGGNVGIGTTSPGAKLEVAGQIRHTLGIISTGAGTAESVAGNARGLGANDLQVFRALAAQVASGDYSAIGGGTENTASGLIATVSGGDENIASGERATVGGGYANTASGRSSIVGGGQANTASQEYATVGGGVSNSASGIFSTVGGGTNNSASGSRASTVGGGEKNNASGIGSTVGGGGADGVAFTSNFGNTASGAASTVSGGLINIASNFYATVGGGFGNTASGLYSTVGGGKDNVASGGPADFSSTVGGGDGNTANSPYSTVGGGRFNTSSKHYAIVGGGDSNTASKEHATVSGGLSNAASGQGATVGGGGRDGVSSYFGNTASGAASTVPGGLANAASGDYSFAAGRRAKANFKGDFVWADSQDSDFNSTVADQFAVRAQGGFYATASSFTFANLAAGTTYLFMQSGGNVGLGTASPASTLQLNGSFASTVTAKSSGYTATDKDHVILADASGGDFTVSLPTAAGIAGRQYVIKKTDGDGLRTVTIDPFGSETIDGSATKALSGFQVATLVSNGSNWFVLSP